MCTLTLKVQTTNRIKMKASFAVDPAWTPLVQAARCERNRASTRIYYFAYGNLFWCSTTGHHPYLPFTVIVGHMDGTRHEACMRRTLSTPGGDGRVCGLWHLTQKGSTPWPLFNRTYTLSVCDRDDDEQKTVACFWENGSWYAYIVVVMGKKQVYHFALMICERIRLTAELCIYANHKCCLDQWTSSLSQLHTVFDRCTQTQDRARQSSQVHAKPQ